jgi:hypothetical protein
MTQRPKYLGDGVYVSVADDLSTIHVWTSDGILETNRIVLERDVLLALLAFLKEVKLP